MTMNRSVDAAPSGTGGRQSFIDRDSHFNGTYATPNDLFIEGRYEGAIDCAGALVIAESADVNARISAGTMSVAGRLQGEIGCRGPFEILPTGRVAARVVAGAIVVHEGAMYEGEMRMRGESDTTPPPPASSGRTDPRPSRRTATTDSIDVPEFPSTTRNNGRSQPDEAAPSNASDRLPTGGKPAGSGGT